MSKKLSDIVYPELQTTQKLSYDAILTQKFMVWKQKLSFVLADHHVLHVLDPSDPIPTDPKWLHDDRIARLQILVRLGDLLISQFQSHTTAKSIMDDLNKLFNKRSPFLFQRYASYRMIPSAHINQHLFRMRAMAKGIAFTGMEIPEEMQVLALLKSLPEDWNDDTERIMEELSSGGNEDLSFDNVSRRLRIANEFREWRDYRSSLTKKGFRGNCYNCGKQGHHKSNCPDDQEKSNADGGSTFCFDFHTSLCEMIYSQLKTNQQLNHTGSNFWRWKDQICTVLMDNKVDYLLNDSAPIEDADNQSRRLSDEFTCRHIMLGGMTDDLFLTFHDYPTGRAMMDALKMWFDSPTVARRMVLYSKYVGHQMSEDTPSTHHVIDMQSMASVLEAAGVKIPDEMQAAVLVDSLPKSWEETRSVLRINMEEAGKGDESLLDRMTKKVRLAADVMQLTARQEIPETRSKRSFKGKCYSCGRTGHYQSDCPNS